MGIKVREPGLVHQRTWRPSRDRRRPTPTATWQHGSGQMSNFQGKSTARPVDRRGFGSARMGKRQGHRRAPAPRRGAAVVRSRSSSRKYCTRRHSDLHASRKVWRTVLPLTCNITRTRAAIASAVEGCVERFGRIDIGQQCRWQCAGVILIDAGRGLVGQQLDFNLDHSISRPQACAARDGAAIRETGRGGATDQHRKRRRHDLSAGWTGQCGLCGREAGLVACQTFHGHSLCPQGIRVNTVIPGSTHTPLVESPWFASSARTMPRTDRRAASVGADGPNGPRLGRRHAVESSSASDEAATSFRNPARVRRRHAPLPASA